MEGLVAHHLSLAEIRPLPGNSAAVETIRVIRTKCLQRLQYVANRQQLCHVLIDLVDYVRDLIDERLVLCADRQRGAVDERVGDAVQAQQIVPQAFRVVKAGTYLIEGVLVQIGSANRLELPEQNEPMTYDEQAEKSGRAVRRTPF